MENKEFFTTLDEAAKYIGCSRRTISRMIASGRFPEPIYSMGSERHKRIWTKKQLDQVVLRPYKISYLPQNQDRPEPLV